ncbi:DUF982 domain-containing protein [Ensifer sp. ENS04]|uniref:DUF982 domain-containing protein n=1 Tax=Ensifer sp. ENS04 TaxID=2769281 RepID=UPI00177D254D|nr:DUF982 domain-containing protein [Ensifer sp. ENS04]MBD9544282.1 DUF982 domain-containing protein [Ensifer sp. ENS04]
MVGPITWKEPVLIKEAVGLTHEVRNLDAAFRVIDTFPVTRLWRRSVDIMIQVNLGNKTAEEGREAFVKAAREAGKLIER